MVDPPVEENTTNQSSIKGYNSCQIQSNTQSISLPQQHQNPYTPLHDVPSYSSNHFSSKYTHTNNPPKFGPNYEVLRDQDPSKNRNRTPKWLLNSQGIQHNDDKISVNYQYPLLYAPSALIIYDPLQNHVSPTVSTSLRPVYLYQIAGFLNHNSYASNLTKSYSSTHPNPVIQPYQKPSILQTLSQAHPTANSNEQKHKHIMSYQLFSNPSTSSVAATKNINSSSDDKVLPRISSESRKSSVKFSNNHEPYTETVIQEKSCNIMLSGSTTKCLSQNTIKHPHEKKYSDELHDFGFSIEAEKMVSDLCNTPTFGELNKNINNNNEKTHRNVKEKITQYSMGISGDFNKFCNDQINRNYKTWNSAISVHDQRKNVISSGVPTLDDVVNNDKWPKFMKKTINWGCDEAEKILKNLPLSSRHVWLSNLLSGTKIANTKSTTGGPVFSDEQIFATDLINSLLRISNGWLILDHYFNILQPSSENKLSKDFVRSLKTWEMSTCDVLQQIIKTFIELENTFNYNNNNSSRFENPNNSINFSTDSSFPGDVCLYVKFGLFGESPGVFPFSKDCMTDYINGKSTENRDKQTNNKCTITKQSRLNKPQISFSNKSQWNNITNKNLSQICQLNSDTSSNKLQPNVFIFHSEDNVNNGKLPTSIIQSKDTQTQCPSGVQEYTNLINFTSTTGNRSKNFCENMEAPSIACSNNNLLLSNNVLNYPTGFTSQLNLCTAPTNIAEKTYDISKYNNRDHPIHTLKNIGKTQTAAWLANQCIDSNNNLKTPQEEYGESKNAQIYVPNRYSVKKKNLSYRNQRHDNIKSKNSGSTSVKIYLDDEQISRNTLLRYNHNSNKDNGNITNCNSSSFLICSQNIPKDATWKAARASAGILLDSLCNTNESTDKDTSYNQINHEKINDDKMTNNVNHKIKIAKKSCKNKITTIKNENFAVLSETNKSISSAHNVDKECRRKKRIKTDSWLIKTLNDAFEEGKNIENQINIQITDKKKLSNGSK